MLDPVSFGQKIWKKRLGMLAFGYRNIRKAACLHATAPKELESIRQFTSTRPVAVIPNPIEVPPDSGLDYQEARTWVAALAPPVRDKRLALCLSRLHPQKRVDLLLSAWAALGDLRRDWHLVVAGPDQLGYTKRMRALVSDLGLAGEVSFPGPVYDQSKWRLYRAAELFILPSPSENFGMVVAEALAAGAPAVATTGTPWSWLRESDCGWHVAPTAEALHDAIAQAISLNAHQREAMGQRGRHLILRRFSGEAVARSMSAVYGWLLGRCEMPGCVDGG
jgi:glycosyltransferase involved in cell wall biosynthesis